LQRAGLTATASVANVVDGDGPWAPVILDSPHSGVEYPADFCTSAPRELLRRGEDFMVDALFDPAGTGARMIAARFPRTYIDPNRPVDDIDGALLGEPWPVDTLGPLNPGPKSAVGKGLIWRLCIGGAPLYERGLRVHEVVGRIERYWRPYRALLARSLDAAHARAGGVWHINCHSMPSIWPEGVEGAGTPVEADFLLGDRDGTTCGRAFRDLVHEVLAGQGFKVAVNDRFKGVDIVACSGDPVGNRHSLQIEVVRDRYMDEARFEPNEGFEAVRGALAVLLREICDVARRPPPRG
jgi:N-formylglutamate amidohydrolase